MIASAWRVDGENKSDVASLVATDKTIYLPDELLARIFHYLNCHQLLVCRAVCKTWKRVISDPLLWHQRLEELMSCTTCSSALVKNESEAEENIIFEEIASHSLEVFLRIIQRLPGEIEDIGIPSLLNVTGIELNGDKTSLKQFIQSLAPRYIPHWWGSNADRCLISRSAGITHQVDRPLYRFAVFGSGLDAHNTHNIFMQLLNGRVGPLETIELFPGRNGYGGGISVRVHGYSQLKALDTSMRPQEVVPPMTLEDCQSDDGTLPIRPRKLRKKRGSRVTKDDQTIDLTEGSNNNKREFNYQLKDYNFDLVYLYSRRVGVREQLQYDEVVRVLNSALFLPAMDSSLCIEEQLKGLLIQEELKPILRSINGVIYALDASLATEDLRIAKHELFKILQQAPSKVPVVILYILPQKNFQVEYKKEPTLEPMHCTHCEKDSNVMSSLLRPLLFLQLDKIYNAWRLQKCYGADPNSLVKGALWLRANQSISEWSRRHISCCNGVTHGDVQFLIFSCTTTCSRRCYY